MVVFQFPAFNLIVFCKSLFVVVVVMTVANVDHR